MKAATVDWRKEPPAWAYEMCAENDAAFDATMWPATSDYNQDRVRMAKALDCHYIEVRMQTEWRVWDPEEAEARWRSENCLCHPQHSPAEIARCGSTGPAKSLGYFWHEDGRYCPWRPCKPSTPGAVKFRIGKVAA